MNIEIKIALIMTGTCLLLLAGFVATCDASIDIYYPDNSTTDIWVGNQTHPVLTHTVSNSIATDDYTCVVIRNQINDSINLVDDPITFVNTFTKIFYAVVFCFAIVAFAYIFKRVIA